MKDVGRYCFSLTRSSIFAPFVFALFTGVDRLYVVGCDVADTGYAKWKHEAGHLKKLGRPFSKMKEAWFWAYTWQQRFYPHVDVVLVNPVGLRGKIGWPQIDVERKQSIFSPKCIDSFLSQKATLQSKRKPRRGSKPALTGQKTSGALEREQPPSKTSPETALGNRSTSEVTDTIRHNQSIADLLDDTPHNQSTFREAERRGQLRLISKKQSISPSQPPQDGRMWTRSSELATPESHPIPNIVVTVPNAPEAPPAPKTPRPAAPSSPPPFPLDWLVLEEG